METSKPRELHQDAPTPYQDALSDLRLARIRAKAPETKTLGKKEEQAIREKHGPLLTAIEKKVNDYYARQKKLSDPEYRKSLDPELRKLAEHGDHMPHSRKPPTREDLEIEYAEELDRKLSDRTE